MMRTSNGLRVEAGPIPVPLIMRVTKDVTLLHKKNLYGKHSQFAKMLAGSKAHHIYSWLT
jgi:hypothetical protein